MGKIESTEARLKTSDSAADKISEMLERYEQRFILGRVHAAQRV